ncbi:MAG TPA: antibiotic biosynthesis monooxygenase [Flavobacteriales bacterium]|nr:antibiotic biosynthesis monooxygenase [Flavobacteriales bacterium]
MIKYTNMISRNWTGLAKKERAQEYIAHLNNETFPKIRAINGFISARILHREISEGIEFLIITEWESVEAIKQFAGEQYHVAMVPPLVREIMLTYDQEVKHYELK